METSAAISRREYLKKYGLNDAEDEKKKNKKKKKGKKPQTASSMSGVLVVDEDPVWQKPVKIHEEDDDDDGSEEEKPQVEEDIEVKRMKRMEKIRARNHGVSEDGSGWVVVSDVAANASDGSRRNDSPDISPPRHTRSDSPDISPPRRTRNDSPDISPPQHNHPSSQNVDLDDISPPRRNRPSLRNVDAMDEDISPPRRNRPDSHLAENLSPPRRNRPSSQNINSLAEDISPTQRSRFHSKKPDDLGADISPTRRNRPHLSDLSPPRKRKSSSKEEGKTGLLTAQEVKIEIERKRKEELDRYKALDPSVSGRGAEPVYRDKEGKRISKDEMLKSKKGEEKPKINISNFRGDYCIGNYNYLFLMVSST
ncbi:Bud13 [Thalictrum thalictroides]|uniref:Bud13 n=1 Tax=Thalictrum thalictroides TaxID=46969 RepID=A0A7J6WRJ5_THATH|nr:Bud13 [Thalictrum thalictroides]